VSRTTLVRADQSTQHLDELRLVQSRDHLRELRAHKDCCYGVVTQFIEFTRSIHRANIDLFGNNVMLRLRYLTGDEVPVLVRS